MTRRLVAEWLGTFSLLTTIVVQLIAALLATLFFHLLLEENAKVVKY